MYDVGMETQKLWRVSGDLSDTLYWRWKQFIKRTDRRSRQTVVDALTEYLDRYDR